MLRSGVGLGWCQVEADFASVENVEIITLFDNPWMKLLILLQLDSLRRSYDVEETVGFKLEHPRLGGRQIT